MQLPTIAKSTVITNFLKVCSQQSLQQNYVNIVFEGMQLPSIAKSSNYTGFEGTQLPAIAKHSNYIVFEGTQLPTIATLTVIIWLWR